MKIEKNHYFMLDDDFRIAGEVAGPPYLCVPHLGLNQNSAAKLLSRGMQAEINAKDCE
jgi:hypothetical protein